MRRWTSKRYHGCKKGDKVKVVGGNVRLGMVGIAKEDGQGSNKVTVETENGEQCLIKAERLIVIELGPEGPDKKNPINHIPKSHNYKNAPRLQRIAPKNSSNKVDIKDQHGNTIGTVSSKYEGSWSVDGTVAEGQPPPKQDQPEPKKENKMAKKEAQRRAASDWNFD
jgi:hypothetical protein